MKNHLNIGSVCRTVVAKVPLLIFLASLIMVGAVYGGATYHFKWFPYSVVARSLESAEVLLRPEKKWVTARNEGSPIPPEELNAHRFEQLSSSPPAESNLLWQGGAGKFTDICPQFGCIAVEFNKAGEVVHGYPFLTHGLDDAPERSEEPVKYERLPGGTLSKAGVVFGMARYANGDLLTTWNVNNGKVRPKQQGIARIDRDGRPVWFRTGYAHHWPHVEEDGTALVLDARFGQKKYSLAIKGNPIRPGKQVRGFKCAEKPRFDLVKVLDENGRLVDSIDLMEVLLADYPAAPIVLMSITRPCDPLHANFVTRLKVDVETLGLVRGDFVVSLKELSAFVILDGVSHRVKRFVKGTFVHQHSVQHLEGSQFLLFDNMGGDGKHGPSRLLMVDLADGSETTVFPNDGTPESLRGLFSGKQGNIDISSDRQRVMIVFTFAQTVVEVRLKDGEALRVFRSFHPRKSDEGEDGTANVTLSYPIRVLDYID